MIYEEGLELIYEKFVAVKTYFIGKYNFFKYKGKLSSKIYTNFQKKKEYQSCITLQKRFPELEEIEKLFVISFWNEKKIWLGSYSMKKYYEYKKYIESNGYIFEEELKKATKDKKLKYLLRSENKSLPELYIMYSMGIVSIYTLLIINMLTDFLDKPIEDFLFEENYQKIRKFQQFLVYWNDIDLEMYKEIILKG